MDDIIVKTHDRVSPPSPQPEDHSPASQNELIESYLKKGKRITSLEALRLFGCLRLSGRIHDLRNNGVAVKSQIVERSGKHVAEYWI